MLDVSNQLVCLNPTAFLQSTASLHSLLSAMLTSQNTTKNDAKCSFYIFFIFRYIQMYVKRKKTFHCNFEYIVSDR